MQNLEFLFQKISHLKVLIIGDVMLDSYIYGTMTRISPEAPVPIVNATYEEERLGGAANVAFNIQTLGATPLLCGFVGKDEASKSFLNLLKKNNIADDFIISSNKRPTTIKTRIISSSQHILRIDNEKDTLLDDAEEQLLLEKLKILIPTANLIIFQDYDKGVLNQKIIEYAIVEAEKKNIPTTVDPKNRNFLFYKKTTLFKPNLKEMKEGLGIKFDEKNLSDLEKYTKMLLKTMQAKKIMVTLSENGICICDTNNFYHYPAQIRKIFDVSGAGDSVISIASVCEAVSVNMRATAEISNIGGGLVCESPGVVPIEKQKLIEELQKRNFTTNLF